ncbi:MAG: hypothetical protein L6Q92_05700 [Phycisphaerae bacterium]|nr:hypothetical protein [Phycisphaerae bacterium]
MRFEVRAAYALGIALPVLETLRRRTDFSDRAAYLDDLIIGALLVAAAYCTSRGVSCGRRFLSGAWGIVCGGMYYSFFGQLRSASATDISGLPNFVVVLIKATIGVIALTAFVRAIR